MGKMMRMILLVIVLVAMMSGCNKVEGRVAVAEQRKLAAAAEDEEMDSGLQDNHHAYSIPDFNRQGGSAPTKY
ncbi:hypothetical protein AAHA92_19768 [Salvia divinorum]|uniref:Uncharacterized protein n=1 Tax=Salvia divinorum TaxID=28513 RepID=A0ABD1GFD2_SALDI